uniref:SH3 domain-containing protein n=1 Tax=Scleropages formosus TaxID=113540 RepID=A0A8C9VGQ3_SCLFO
FSLVCFVTTPAAVLPGECHESGLQQSHSYLHQSSTYSERSIQSPLHSTYRAMYDYMAQDNDEVSFRDGDMIINAQSIDEGWMYGTVQRTGKSGMFPANYMECFN